MAEQSRNSWISKDDPKLVSARQKDMFEDILEERRLNGEFRYCLRARDEPAFKLNKRRTPAQIKEHVMNSDRVQYAIEQACIETKLPRSEVMAEASAILDEMAHNQNMGAIRSFAFVLVKIFKALYQRIYVNVDGIQKVRGMVKEYPILLMPSHRSYMDFLLMSYVFYHYDLPLPVIAAAMDFLGMKFVGWLLRNSGAFYIRRSFGDDHLYWAVFTEYVQTHICNGDSPIEFYVEGTRSRTSKSYTPKFGMLSAALEPYFKSHIPDVMVVPVSISYDRILEESLYAYELLGVPKPKESTSGLFKARKILEDDFGNVHIYFGEPISIRKYSEGLVDRSLHNLAPRYIASLTNQEQDLIKKLGHHMVLTHQKHMVVSPWNMMAAVLMQCQEGISVRQLAKEVEWVKRQASNMGAYIDWPASETAESVLRANIKLHSNIVRVNTDDVVELVSVAPPAHTKATDAMMITAGQHLMLSLYRNHILHVFVRPAMIAISVNSCTSERLSIDDLFTKYCFLEQLLSKDFVFVPGSSRIDFDLSLRTLTHTSGIVMELDEVVIGQSVNKLTTFYSQMFEPFLLGYWILCQYLLSNHPNVAGKPLAKTQKTVVKETQMLTARLLQEGVIKQHYEILSLDMMNNGLQALFHMGAVIKERRDGVVYMYPNTRQLSNVTENLAKFIDVPRLPAVSINIHSKTVTVNAKL
ncbi:dihydroxyacetone phosphate acyltransferase [Biomphalaria glabrata]|uniref:Phospholipid/glycerol acyltransferase domain-containing protein n=1 Tax=Biomphalaria glabrata TaxID=6526 RepID=A0A2C9JYM1_BIOGL|nr:dihydroxyacetone phosphate acyltransferase-like [Biomphalaria glabrata]